MFKKFALGAALAASVITALPSAAQARHHDYYSGDYYGRGYDHGYRGDPYRSGRYYESRNRGYGRHYYGRGYGRCSGTTGTIVGGATGALIGREVAGRRGSRTTGTILGGALGALLGREVGRSSC